MEKIEKIKKIKHNNEHFWRSLPGVVSIGIGLVNTKDPGIIIGVKNKKSSLINEIPSDIEGVPIEIKVVNELKAF